MRLTLTQHESSQTLTHGHMESESDLVRQVKKGSQETVSCTLEQALAVTDAGYIRDDISCWRPMHPAIEQTYAIARNLKWLTRLKPGREGPDGKKSDDSDDRLQL